MSLLVLEKQPLLFLGGVMHAEMWIVTHVTKSFLLESTIHLLSSIKLKEIHQNSFNSKLK